MRCRLCLSREPDPRRIIHADAFVPRYGQIKRGIPVHVECWLAAGEDIAGLADDQLWHLPTAAWEHFGFFDEADGYAEAAVEPSTALPDHGNDAVPQITIPLSAKTLRRRSGQAPTPPQRSWGGREEVWGRSLPSRVGRAPRARGTAGSVGGSRRTPRAPRAAA